MFKPVSSPVAVVNHMSLVWGVVLALITILDWGSLEKDPLNEEILTPFISREISMVVPESGDGEPQQMPLQYQVELHFDGVMFLLYFFVPVIILHLIARVMESRKGPTDTQ